MMIHQTLRRGLGKGTVGIDMIGFFTGGRLWTRRT